MRYNFEILLDFETGERAGAAGTFQIASLEDEAGKDWSDSIDQGKHYDSVNEVREDLAQRFGCDPMEIHIEVTE
jgi:hypothetical protein